MSVIRVEKTGNYTVMSNYHFKERKMSLKAKGLLSLMLSLPNDWDYSISGLIAICKENETAIRSALKELQQFGYVIIDKIMPNNTKSGRIEYIYTILEKPKQEGKKQGVENLYVETQCVENPAQLNTNKSNTNKLNTNINKKSENKDSTSKKSKIDRKLESIEKKCLEYDLEDEAIELLGRFFRNLLEDNRLVTDDKVKATLRKLAVVNKKTQLDAIQLSLDKGYTSIDPNWLKPDNNRSKKDTSIYWEGGTHKSDEDRQAYFEKLLNDPNTTVF